MKNSGDNWHIEKNYTKREKQMSIYTDVYYNANETVLKAVQQHIKNEHGVDSIAREGFLFVSDDHVIDMLIGDADSIVLDENTTNKICAKIDEISQSLEYVDSPFMSHEEMRQHAESIASELEFEDHIEEETMSDEMYELLGKKRQAEIAVLEQKEKEGDETAVLLLLAYDLQELAVVNKSLMESGEHFEEKDFLPKNYLANMRSEYGKRISDEDFDKVVKYIIKEYHTPNV